MKKFKFWKILVAVLLICVLSFSLIACNPEDPDPTETTKSWVKEKTEALNLILGSAVTGLKNGFAQAKSDVINLNFSADWINNPVEDGETKENYTVTLKGNLDITGGNKTSLMFELVHNNALDENKLVFGAYYIDANNDSDLFIVLKNDNSLTGEIFGDQPYITGRIDFASVAAIVNLVNSEGSSSAENTNFEINIDTIIGLIAGFCKDPEGADPTSTANPYITTNSDGSKDVKITIDLGSVMNTIKTMGGALLSFISPTDENGNNIYGSLESYFKSAGIYINLNNTTQWVPLSQTNVPDCTGIDVVLSAKVDSSNTLQNIGIEFINNVKTFDILLGVPFEEDFFTGSVLSCKELLKFHFTKGTAKLYFNNFIIGNSADESVKSEIQSKIDKTIADYAETMAESNNMLSMTVNGTVKRYDSDSDIENAKVLNYTLKLDIDIVGAVMAGLEYAYNPSNKVVKTEGMSDAQYNEKLAEFWEGIVNSVMKHLKNDGNEGKGLIEYIFKDSSGAIDSYLYFNAKDIDLENRQALIDFYTTDDNTKTKAVINLYDVAQYLIDYEYRALNTKTDTDYKDVIFNTLKTISLIWGKINLVDDDNDGVVNYIEIDKNFKEALYTLFGTAESTQDSFNKIFDILFDYKNKMSISVESISFGNVGYETKLSPSGFTGAFGNYAKEYYECETINIGDTFTLSTNETVKIMNCIIMQRGTEGAVTQVKILAWKCGENGIITSAGGLVYLTVNGNNIRIVDVNGETIS